MTIAVPTFNGAETLDELLAACEAQATAFAFDLLVIDSTSADRTPEILSSHPKVRVHRIAQEDFGHGRTRNLAVELARGEIVAFLTQDAVPATATWLAELVEPFRDAQVACTYGRQIPRPSCQPVVKNDVTRWFDRLATYENQPNAREDFEESGPDFRAFFSNVNSAVRRSVLQGIPFREVDFAEDRALAADILAAGGTKVYVASAAVWHSHDLALLPYYRRMKEEARALRNLGQVPRDSTTSLILAALAGTARDILFVLRDPDYRAVPKLRWVLKVPAFNIARRVAIRRSRRQV
ncbi:MAG TPA: glycosyltransferase family 2 protein [Acidimicrobiales bacterium]|nr:glycosyltransferase family 2 protein [Acidimicrobiales bacterium]